MTLIFHSHKREFSHSRRLHRANSKGGGKSSNARKEIERSGKKMNGQESDDPKQSTADMTSFVQNLLQQMQSRFQAMSESIVSKIDEMGGRIDELEKSINDLKAEMGPESTSSPLAPSKTKSEETKPEDGSS